MKSVLEPEGLPGAAQPDPAFARGLKAEKLIYLASEKGEHIPHQRPRRK